MTLTQSWPRPTHPRPIVIIGAGGIVRAAHLPAYRKLRIPVAGLYDLRLETARETASLFGVERVFETLADACARDDVVFDLAIPGDQILGVLASLPPGAPVLIQKPPGQDLAAARAIHARCQEKTLTAAVNFQLRFSPGVLALRDLLARGALGRLVDVEVRVVIEQPWPLWTFLKTSPRVEILYHSIHYLDTIRWLAGEPWGVYCRAVRHPEMPELQDVRSSIILDYGEQLRCSLCLNHTYRQGPRQRASLLKLEGTAGAAIFTMGVNLGYPNGGPDALALCLAGGDWEELPLRGSWFIEAFEGPMSNLQRFAAGEDDVLLTSIEDSVKTMALVEACYESSARGATAIPSV